MSLAVISATEPVRFRDSFTEIGMIVWFEGFTGPVPFTATPFDTERHGKALWIRAMAGEFGPISVIDVDSPCPFTELPQNVLDVIEAAFGSQRKISNG